MLDRGSLLPGRLVYVVMIPSSAAVSPITNTNMYIRLWTIRTAAIAKCPTFSPLVSTNDHHACSILVPNFFFDTRTHKQHRVGSIILQLYNTCHSLANDTEFGSTASMKDVVLVVREARRSSLITHH
ncbi:hypothetical protein F5050DRAFT_1271300 [Lentinula boryana]|uniref:Secreted protein n=1 Tax=Lentinula boryana TaxID=40481 RepID=A0ABQ8QIB0_9AGAR|nr:hypothetical protein F5050DRAFT_1271300 [Lentinula boryana]